MARFNRSKLEGGSRLSQARRIVNAIPDNGCVLVFNGNHVDFRKVAQETGCLSCHVATSHQGSWRNGNELVNRDLYITWRGE